MAQNGRKEQINVLPDGIWNGEVGGVNIYRGNLGFPNCFHGLYSGLKLCRATRRKTEGQPGQYRKPQPIKTSKRIVNFSRERQSAITDNRLDFAHTVITGNSTKYTVYYIYQNFFNNTHPVFTQLLSAICPRVYYVMIFQLSTYTKDCC